MKRLILGLIVAILAVSVAIIPTEKARAGLTDYTTLWNSVHLYDDYDLTLGFAGLDSSASYQWTVQLIDIETGNPFVDIGRHTHIPGTTTDSFSIGPGTTPLLNHLGDWPFLFTGPFQVRDNYGQIVMRGFLAPQPDPDGDQWKSGTGNNAYVDKVVIGSPTHVEPVQNPVYNPVSAEGWHYDVATGSGIGQNAVDTDEFALMHFNLDCATYIGAGYGPNDGYYIYDFGGTEVARFPFNEIIDFQERELLWPPGACGVANEMIFESFMVLNTKGGELPFVDNTRANAIFTTYQNPMNIALPPGAYYVQKVVGAVPVADGEAPFLISNGDKGVEYRIDIGKANVTIGENQSMIFRAFTQEIWDDYHGAQTCEDGPVGSWSDSTVYSFATARAYEDSVAGAETENEWISCFVVPLGITTTTMTAFEARIVYRSPGYDVIVGNAGVEDALNQLIKSSKLNTDSGLNLVFAGLLAVGVLLVTLIPGARSNTFAYLIVWTGLGGVWSIAGPATSLGISMFLMITVVLWVLALSGNQGGGQIENS